MGGIGAIAPWGVRVSAGGVIGGVGDTAHWGVRIWAVGDISANMGRW